MSRKKSRTSEKQRQLVLQLTALGFRSRWWGSAGKPASRLYLRRENKRGQLLAEPFKVYLEFDEPRELRGSRLVVGDPTRTRVAVADEERIRSLTGLYAAAIYTAALLESPEALAAHKRRYQLLSLPDGAPA